MADFNTITIAGNLTQDPELRFTATGTALCDLQVVTSKSVKNADGTWESKDAVFWTVTAWRQVAENAAASLKKGMSVIIIGAPVTKEWEGKDGTKRTKIEINAEHVALSLNRYSAVANRVMSADSYNSHVPNQPTAPLTSWVDNSPSANSTADTPF